MATYKVIQDIEAEDHILGPLSLRQFIYAILSVLCLYFCYLAISKHVTFLLVIFLPPALFTGFFAFPFGKDQPTEIWALAKIRFLFKPRRRIWDQSGVKDLVTITVPKKIEERRTDGLSQVEIRSRLSALANTIDSRGWAVKNVNVNLYSQPGFLTGVSQDRLVDVDSIPQNVPNFDVQAADDIMDEQNNPIAHQFDQMIAASSQAHREQITNMLNQSSPQATNQSSRTSQPPTDYWFLNQPAAPPKLGKDQAMFASDPVVLPGTTENPAVVPAAEPTADEEALAERLKAEHDKPNPTYAHMKTIQPIDKQKPTATPVPTSKPKQPDPVNAQLAGNDDLNVATLARIANKQDEPPEDEVVISLH